MYIRKLQEAWSTHFAYSPPRPPSLSHAHCTPITTRAHPCITFMYFMGVRVCWCVCVCVCVCACMCVCARAGFEGGCNRAGKVSGRRRQVGTYRVPAKTPNTSH
jgi:hypothetical protein